MYPRRKLRVSSAVRTSTAPKAERCAPKAEPCAPKRQLLCSLLNFLSHPFKIFSFPFVSGQETKRGKARKKFMNSKTRPSQVPAPSWELLAWGL